MRTKNFRSVFLVSLILVLAVCLTACGGDETSVATTITCKDEFNIVLDKSGTATGTIPASVNYEAKDHTLEFVSNNTSIISFDNKTSGKYTAKGVGNTTVTITAYDGTKKVVKINVTKLAESIDFSIQPNDTTIIKHDTIANFYYIILKTANEGTLEPIPFTTKVFPVEASQDVTFEVKNAQQLLNIEGNSLIFSYPKKANVNYKDIKVDINAEGLENPLTVTFRMCAYDSSEMQLNFNDGKNKNYDAANNKLTIYKSDMEFLVLTPFGVTFGDWLYEPDIDITIYVGDKEVKPYHTNINESIKVQFAGLINAGETKDAEFVITDRNTGQVWKKNVSLYYYKN